jgi:hypothetical protein
MTPKGDYQGEDAGETFADLLGTNPGMAEAMDAPPVGMDLFRQLADKPPPSLKDAPGTSPPSFMSDPAYLKVTEQIDKTGARADELMQQRRGAIDQAQQDVKRGLADINATPFPRQDKMPKEPSSQELSRGSMEWVQAATVLASLGGFFARGNATTALNAFAGAVKGFTEGRREDFAAKKEEWKEASARLKEDNQARLDAYNDIMKRKQFDMTTKLSMAKTVATEYGDEIGYNLTEQGHYVQFAQFLERSWQQHETFLQKQQQIDQQLAPVDGKMLDFYADYYNKTGKMPTLGYSKNAGALREQIAQRAEERAAAKGKSAEDVAQGQTEFAANRAGATTQARRAQTLATNVENATNEVQQLIPQAMQTSRALPRGKFVPWNTVRQAYEAGKSDPAYNDFVLANFSLINAYTRAMNPQGVPRVNDRLEQHANGILSVATSQQAYETQVRRLWQEVLASREATKRTVQGVGTQPNEPFPGDEPGAEGQVGGENVDPLGMFKH